MSKKARNKRMVRAMSVPVPMAAVPRSAHEHSYTRVRTNGNRIRRGCDCGDWRKWRPMTDVEKTAYKPTQEETVDDNPHGKTDAQRHADHFNSASVRAEIAKRKAQQTGVPVIVAAQQPKDDPTPQEVSGLKDLLMKAQDMSISMATGSALNIADQAGVNVAPDLRGHTLQELRDMAKAKGIPSARMRGMDSDAIIRLLESDGDDLDRMLSEHDTTAHQMPTHGDTPAFRRTGITDIDADAANRKTWPVKKVDACKHGVGVNEHCYQCPEYAEEFDSNGNVRTSGDDVRLTRVDKYGANDEEGCAEHFSIDHAHAGYCPEGPDDADDEDEGHTAEDYDGVWVLSTHGNLTIYPRNEVEEDIVVETGPAGYDPIADDWFVPAAVCKRLGFVKTNDGYKHKDAYPKDETFILEGDVDEDVDDAKVAAFVAESFGDESEQAFDAAYSGPRYRVALDFGNDNIVKVEHPTAHLMVNALHAYKRDDLEFAARVLGIRGVTTKVKKHLLVRAIVAFGDTTLVKEHAANRAAVMLRTAPVKDSDTEWAQHYWEQNETEA